jgi:hypothetical protein
MNRYDFIEPSNTIDEATGNVYPDPLSISYFDLKPTVNPSRRVMTVHSANNFRLEAWEVYKGDYADDLLLTLNGIPHKNFIKAGDVIYYPALDDIKRSFGKNI